MLSKQLISNKPKIIHFIQTNFKILEFKAYYWKNK